MMKCFTAISEKDENKSDGIATHIEDHEVIVLL